jgi:RNA polymerase sigma-70 factor, ECF subfamily
MDRFTAHVRVHVRDLGSGPAEGERRGAELYLAIACALGDPAALAIFDEAYLAPLARTLRFMRPTASFVDEARQLVREQLFVSDPEGSGKIATYSGRGALANWVGVVAQRIALGLARSRGAAAVAPEAPPPAPDPEAEYLRKRYLPEFREAITEALRGLSDRQRVLLRLNLVRGVSMDAIAVMYGVDQSTISRWLAQARRTLQDEVERSLARRLRLEPRELLSLLRALRSDLDLSVSRVLEESVSPSAFTKPG